ncbi:hypothetical protein EDC44_101183 [Cricetibacter osteomyelitidis]|uniref:Lipoprotein n=1 Tax=Cricetibacter osteomyelitidis TaxID=1521931 RepID=A0A4R2T6P8_9PAST|nr:hypothetical protein [Cricetibacter osteomyelitidis]TCP97795.1 hypothetical protein EDC44_101183 [Cricetibacter osteomyelitidis]
MMKKVIILFLSILLVACFNNSLIQDEDMALEKVVQSIEKHKLTLLERECLFFISNDKGTYYEIEVREKHNEKCGGDPLTAPRLFSYEVDKQTGKMQTDEPVWRGEKRKID